MIGSLVGTDARSRSCEVTRVGEISLVSLISSDGFWKSSESLRHDVILAKAITAIKYKQLFFMTLVF